LQRVAIVSPYFPPSTLAAVHRARHLAKHLPALGWEPVILCVDEVYHEERLDPGLGALLPAGLEIVKVPAISARMTRFATVGDVGVRAYPYLASALTRLIRRQDPKVVLITGSPFYPMLLARLCNRLGKPVILDFQDPWVSNWGASQLPLTKSGIAHRLAKLLEPIAVRNARFITSVSDRQNSELATRYPWFDRSRMAAVPIGGDPDDYGYLRGHAIEGQVKLSPQHINFTYAGTLLPRAVGVVEQLFAAIARVVDGDPELSKRLRFTFVGTSNQPNGFNAHRVTSLAAAHGIAGLVSETPQRVPYLEALSLAANSDVLLLIGSDEPHYTASKIYPALLSGRPCLGLFHKASSAFDILSRSGGARILGFDSVADLASRTEDIAAAIRDLALRPESAGSVAPSVIGPYHARAIAQRFAEIFQQVAH
jgi:Glycosyl transferase 4-like domain